MNAREVALAAVRDVFGPERRAAQAALDFRARNAGLDTRDAAFACELAYGAIKQRRLLDWYLAPYLAGRAKPLPDAILEVLRLGVYQLRCMDGVDAHAAVYETVNLALRHGHRGTAGLVNAVLRRVAADAPHPPERADFPSDDDFVGTAYSLPTWIAAQFGAVFDGDRLAIVAGLNAAPRHTLRVNAVRASVAEARDALASAGTAVTPSQFVAEALVVESGPVRDDEQARWAIQSESACMPVDLLNPQPGETIAELCSGRGNKAVQIGARMRSEGTLYAVERDTRKVRVLRERLEAAGAAAVAIVEGDVREVDVPPVDAVLLDAPCSGLGILGRHPEARWRKEPGDPPRLARAQTELLASAGTRVRPGGRLVYAVCSTDPREGREVVDGFLADAGDFARTAAPERYAPFLRDGDIVVPPGIDGRDGFYIALLGRAP